MAEENITPPWGYLPVEQYLIRSWDWDSMLPQAEQRHRLVSSFLAARSLPSNHVPGRDGAVTREPSSEEVSQVLQPWRSAGLRKIASEIWTGTEFIILRTHYGGGEAYDAKLQQWLEIEEEEDDAFDEDALWWRILNDPALFGVEDNWHHVLAILPELAGRPGRFVLERGISEQDLAECREAYDPIDEIQWSAFTYSSNLPILVADKTAFETDELLVLFLDGYGNLVRSSRLAVNDVTLFKELYEQGHLRRYHWWERASVGLKYQQTGDMGRGLYPGITGVRAGMTEG